jgi:hypothetical protein
MQKELRHSAPYLLKPIRLIPEKAHVTVKRGIHKIMIELMAPQDYVVKSSKTRTANARKYWQKIIPRLCLASLLLCSSTHAEVIRTAMNEAGVVVLTNSEVQTGELNLSNLRAIFTIRKRSWDDKTPIKVFVLPDQNPLHQQFCKSVLKVYPYVLREQWDRLIFSGTGIPPTIVSNEQELQAIINATPGAIGYAPSDTLSSTAELSRSSSELFVLRTSSEY